MSTLSAISFILFIICFVLTIVFAISEYKKNKNIQRNVPTNQNTYSRTATRASRRRPKKSWKLTIRFLVATIAFFTLSGIFANRAAESYSSSDDTSSDVNKSEPNNPKIKKAPPQRKVMYLAIQIQTLPVHRRNHLMQMIMMPTFRMMILLEILIHTKEVTYPIQEQSFR